MSGPDELLLANDKLVERLLDNAACASQERQLLRDADDTETALREAVRRNVAVPLIAANAALAARCESVDQQLSRVLHEMAGAVSLCWNPRPTGVFDSTQAAEFVAAAIAELRALASQAEGER